MHQQVIAGIVLPAHILADPGSHGNGGDTGGANEGIDLPLGHHVQDFTHEQTAYSRQNKRKHTQGNDL